MSMRALAFASLAAASLLGAGSANAETIIFEPSACGGCDLSQSFLGPLGPNEVVGNFVSSGQLVFADDYISFEVEPANTTGTVSVDFSANPLFPGEQWQLVTGTATGTVVVNPTSVASTTESLTAGVIYYLELASTGPAQGGEASSEVTVTVPRGTGEPNPTPLPAALPLFASGLGLMGWLSRRRRQKAA